MQTEADLKQFLIDNKESIATEVRNRLTAQLIESHRWSITEGIVEAVNVFVKEEIVPAVREHLQSEKSAILEAAISTAQQVGQRMAEQMTENAAKNIKSYRFNEVMKGLFS